MDFVQGTVFFMYLLFSLFCYNQHFIRIICYLCKANMTLLFVNVSTVHPPVEGAPLLMYFTVFQEHVSTNLLGKKEKTILSTTFIFLSALQGRYWWTGWSFHCHCSTGLWERMRDLLYLWMWKWRRGEIHFRHMLWCNWPFIAGLLINLRLRERK